MEQNEYSILKLLVDKKINTKSEIRVAITSLASNVNLSNNDIKKCLKNLAKEGYFGKYILRGTDELQEAFILMNIKGIHFVQDVEAQDQK